MAEPLTLSSEEVKTLLAAVGGKGDIVRQNGVVYQVQADGRGKEVTGIPPEAVKQDTNPTTIHVQGRGWLEYIPAAGGWGVIQGTEELPEAPKLTIIEGGDGKRYSVKLDSSGNPLGTEIAGVPGTPPSSRAATTVAPGHAVQNPDGTWTVPVPDTTRETPAQAHQARLTEITAQANAQGDALLKAAKDKVAAGLEMTAEDTARLKSQLDELKAQHDDARATAMAQFTHELGQSDRDREFGLQQQTAEATRAANEQSARLRGAEGQAKALTDQSAAGQSIIKMALESGVSPDLDLIHYAFDPLAQVQQLMRQAVAQGKVPASALPTPIAPRPAPAAAAPPTAPLPAPDPADAEVMGVPAYPGTERGGLDRRLPPVSY